jgi:hypothetical protein
MPIPETAPVLKALEMCRSRFVFGLDRTPDDRLNWSPGGAASTPLQLGAKLAGFLETIGYMLKHRQWPDRDATPPPAPTTREEAKRRVDSACGRLGSFIGELTTADLEGPVPAPWGQATAGEMLGWVNGVILYHQGQLNYVQLCYGDLDPNMPPDWVARAGE